MVSRHQLSDNKIARHVVFNRINLLTMYTNVYYHGLNMYWTWWFGRFWTCRSSAGSQLPHTWRAPQIIHRTGREQTSWLVRRGLADAAPTYFKELSRQVGSTLGRWSRRSEYLGDLIVPRFLPQSSDRMTNAVCGPQLWNHFSSRLGNHTTKFIESELKTQCIYCIFFFVFQDTDFWLIYLIWLIVFRFNRFVHLCWYMLFLFSGVVIAVVGFVVGISLLAIIVIVGYCVKTRRYSDYFNMYLFLQWHIV